MALSFGASDGSGITSLGSGSAGNPGAQSGLNPLYSLLGTGLGVASQFTGNGLAPGYAQSNLPSFMQSQWQNVFNAQNSAANRPASQAIAGFTPAQLQAMQGIQNNQTLGLSDLQNAQNQAQTLSQGVGAPQISNFMNPFTQSAVNSTLATMQQQQNQQDAAINSQANGAGAWGGDRSAVAQNLNDQGWQLAQGNVIANLNNQGYQSAVNSALQNQGYQLQGNAQLQNAILNRVNAANMGNQNLLAVGNQQQAQNQQVANYPITQAGIMARNLNPLAGRGTTGYGQNPITGALAGIQGGLQFGNSLQNMMQQGQQLYNGANSLFGGGTSPQLSGFGSSYSGILSDGTIDPSTFSSFGDTIGNSAADTSLLDSLDFSSAGGGAAAAASASAAAPAAASALPAGTVTAFNLPDAAAAAAPAADTAASGAAGSGAAWGNSYGIGLADDATGSGAGASGAMATMGPYLAAAAPAAVAAFGAMQAPFTLSGNYWNGVTQALKNGNGGQIGGLNYGAGSQQAQYNQLTAQQGLVALAANRSADSADIGGANGINIPPSVLAAYPGGAAQFYRDVAAYKSQTPGPAQAQSGVVGSRNLIRQQ